MTDAPTAYPLAWPRGWPRTAAVARRDSKFRTDTTRVTGRDYRTSKSVTVPDARARLTEQIDMIDARYAVLSTNLELRLDGQPRGGQMEPTDPGVAVYFQRQGKPLVLACDKWNTVAGNIAAIAAHIDALRGMERWGVGTADQLFAGFAALPPAAPGQRDWREVLERPVTLAEAEATYRRLIRERHPDAGGSHEQAAELTAAIAEARGAMK